MLLGAVEAAGNPLVPLPPGPPFFRFSDPSEAARSLSAVGFEDSASETVAQTWDEGVSSPDDLYDVFLRGTARTRVLLEGQTPAEESAVREELHRRYTTLIGASGRSLNMPAVVSSGTKPDY